MTDVHTPPGRGRGPQADYGRRWTPEADRLLLELWPSHRGEGINGLRGLEIRLNRSRSSIESRYYRLRRRQRAARDTSGEPHRMSVHVDRDMRVVLEGFCPLDGAELRPEPDGWAACTRDPSHRWQARMVNPGSYTIEGVWVE